MNDTRDPWTLHRSGGRLLGQWEQTCLTHAPDREGFVSFRSFHWWMTCEHTKRRWRRDAFAFEDVTGHLERHRPPSIITYSG